MQPAKGCAPVLMKIVCSTWDSTLCCDYHWAALFNGQEHSDCVHSWPRHISNRFSVRILEPACLNLICASNIEICCDVFLCRCCCNVNRSTWRKDKRWCNTKNTSSTCCGSLTFSHQQATLFLLHRQTASTPYGRASGKETWWPLSHRLVPQIHRSHLQCQYEKPSSQPFPHWRTWCMSKLAARLAQASPACLHLHRNWRGHTSCKHSVANLLNVTWPTAFCADDYPFCHPTI